MNDYNNVTIDQLMDVGAHYGSLVSRWNPKIAPYIYGQRNNFYLFNLEKTISCIKMAMRLVHEITYSNGKLLFVGTDEISSQCAKYYAKKSNQFYLHKSWFGGTLTNWKHFSNYLQSLNEKENIFSNDFKKDIKSYKKFLRLSNSLEGIRYMDALPNLIIVLNTQNHRIAIKEANIVNVPVIGIVDTDCDPDGIAYPIPGNNDNVSCMKFYCELLTSSISVLK